MRIGIVAPPWVPVPPPAYGGTEVVVDNLARGLTALGHDVRLFTVGDSTCPVARSCLFPHPATPMGLTVDEVAHVLAAYEQLEDVDVIHDHTTVGMLLAGERPGRRQVLLTTHHGTFAATYRRVLARAARHGAIVAISHAQAATAAEVPVRAVIHHGIDLERYRPGPGGGGYLMFVGRMSPDKGVHRAVRVARRAGMPLVVAVKMREPDERAYFEQVVRPLLTPDVEIMCEPPAEERIALLGRAEALLDPIGWPEPFGLVMAESLACGTPVVACPRGAAPEIVDDGITGYLRDDDAGLVAAVQRVDRIGRDACRAAARERFSLARMAGEYERLYERLLANRPAALPRGVREGRPHRPAGLPARHTAAG